VTGRPRVRFHTWYWGKWVFEGELGLRIGVPGVEPYDDALHGWHNSTEAIRMQKSMTGFDGIEKEVPCCSPT
jgi:hypothetical protein